MSLNYRIKRLDQMCRVWNLKRSHDLMAYYDVDKKIFKDFKDKVKLYISKALKIDFCQNDKIFLKSINLARKNRINITPNGGAAPK